MTLPPSGFLIMMAPCICRTALLRLFCLDQRETLSPCTACSAQKKDPNAMYNDELDDDDYGPSLGVGGGGRVNTGYTPIQAGQLIYAS